MGVTFTMVDRSSTSIPSETKTTKVTVNSNVKITNYAEGQKGPNSIEIFVKDGKKTITGVDENGKPTGKLRSADFNSQKYDLMNKLIDSDTTDGDDTLSEADLKAAMKKGINGAKVIADKDVNANGKYTIKFNDGEVLTFDFETETEVIDRISEEQNISNNTTKEILTVLQEMQDNAEMKLSPKSDLEKFLIKVVNWFKGD